MKALHVFLALTLIGCSGSSTGLASPTQSVSPVVETPSPSSTPAPLMNGLPTTFAPCAGNARTVKRAAYNCLRDWKPAMETYPGKVVYHFSPSITASEKAAIREATEFALVRAEGYITTAGFAPEFHLFYNMDDWKACKKLLKSWAGTADNTWLYAGEGVAGSGALCSPNGFGGRGIDPSLPGTAVAAMSTPRNHEVFGDWVFPYYTYRVLPHEVVSSMPFAIGESRLGSVWAGLNVAPRWIGYAASRAAWQSAGIQLLNDDLEDFHNGLLPQPGAATWQPTVSDPRFGPVPEDFQGLMSETPWVYAVMDLASQYMTAMFGPDWIQKVLFPIMVSEETHVNNITAFRLEADRVAQRLWGGKWSELESAVDDYVLSEFRAAGITGLE